MTIDSSQLLCHVKEFLALQQTLVNSWLSINNSSHDMELLLDFPKQCKLFEPLGVWNATRHGLGVRFVREDGVIVDVPSRIDKPQSFDPGRLFDYITSLQASGPSISSDDRPSFYTVFDELCHEGKVVADLSVTEALLYRLPSASAAERR